MTVQPDPHLLGIGGFPHIARMASRGNRLATLVSAFAFAFSAVSFYETVMKQPNLHTYVTDTLAYTRDPWGGYEVIAMPLTISNSGARDGTAISLELEVRNVNSGKVETFIGRYTADAQYFGSIDDVSKRIKRPKLPFAPISIIGRTAYSGTVLFYSSTGREQRLIDPKDKVDLTLRILVPHAEGWIDSLFASRPSPIELHVQVADFLPGALLAGDTADMRLIRQAPQGQPQGQSRGG